MNLFAVRRETQTQRMDMWAQRRGVHSEMGTDTWALLCVKQTVGPYYIVQGAQPGALC